MDTEGMSFLAAPDIADQCCWIWSSAMQYGSISMSGPVKNIRPNYEIRFEEPFHPTAVQSLFFSNAQFTHALCMAWVVQAFSPSRPQTLCRAEGTSLTHPIRESAFFTPLSALESLGGGRRFGTPSYYVEEIKCLHI
ncbi:hypothetical protein AYO22_05134 [Fonsecaea multimorphosa]|nr:hypothetical protein AYO22_05134 [Fonsecaea multimorphosa]